MILLLLFVGVVYSIWGELQDAITIFTIIILLVLSEIFTEYRAKKAVIALNKLVPPTVPVIRDGAYQQIPTEQIVKGDILVLEVGVRVPADARIIESYGLESDESPLTGESMPVAKAEKSCRRKLHWQREAIWFCRQYNYPRSRYGRSNGNWNGDRAGENHRAGAGSQRASYSPPDGDAPARRAAGVGGPGLQRYNSSNRLFAGQATQRYGSDRAFSIIATIPEELPIVITMVLGVGAMSLSRHNVLVRRLRAAETLGSVTVVVTDKTGTLTENKMTLTRLVTNSNVKTFSTEGITPAETALLRAGILTSDVKKGADGQLAGDPLEIALVKAANKGGVVPGETI